VPEERLFVPRMTSKPRLMVAWVCVALVTGEVGDEVGDTGDTVETSYGWCGLCQSFTVFPHECAGADRPPQEETA
jgi:hypothetical protein